MTEVPQNKTEFRPVIRTQEQSCAVHVMHKAGTFDRSSSWKKSYILIFYFTLFFNVIHTVEPLVLVVALILISCRLHSASVP